jgi:chitinase
MTHRRTITAMTTVLAAVCAAVLAWPAAANAATGAPSNLRVTGASYDTVSLAWDPAGGSVAYYQILRNGRWVDSAYGTTATLRYLTASTTYTVEVRARDTTGNVSPSVSVNASTQADTGPPTPPANLRVVLDQYGRPGLDWDPSADDRGVGMYWLFADGGFAFGGGDGVSFSRLTDVECTLFSGETYTFTVRAMDLSGNLSASGTPLTVTVP